MDHTRGCTCATCMYERPAPVILHGGVNMTFLVWVIIATAQNDLTDYLLNPVMVA